jgi:hypothetical protein
MTASGLIINLSHMHPRLELDGEYDEATGCKVLRHAWIKDCAEWGQRYAETRRALLDGTTTLSKVRKAWWAGDQATASRYAVEPAQDQVRQADAPAKRTKRNRSESGAMMAKLKEMLQRKAGCTRPEILEATGWTAVSVQQQAKALGLKLTVDQDQQPYRYYGK